MTLNESFMNESIRSYMWYLYYVIIFGFENDIKGSDFFTWFRETIKLNKIITIRIIDLRWSPVFQKSCSSRQYLWMMDWLSKLTNSRNRWRKSSNISELHSDINRNRQRYSINIWKLVGKVSKRIEVWVWEILFWRCAGKAKECITP